MTLPVPGAGSCSRVPTAPTPRPRNTQRLSGRPLGAERPLAFPANTAQGTCSRVACRLQLQGAPRGLLGAPPLATAALLPLCLLPVLGLALLLLLPLRMQPALSQALLLALRMRPALSQALLLPVLPQSSCRQQRAWLAQGRRRPQQRAHKYILQPAAMTPVQLLVVASLLSHS